MTKLLKNLLILSTFLTINTSFAQNPDNIPLQSQPNEVEVNPAPGPVAEKAKEEQEIEPNYHAITFYKPNYILPYYYTGSPYYSIYQGNTPNNEKLKSSEFKFQLSFKVPAWRNILKLPTTLFFAYSQQSYWQVYNKNPFFRETDFEPEIFLANELNIPIYKDFHVNFINIGAVHQSNGFGNDLERSWNRAYLELISSGERWMFSIKPWYIMSTNSANDNIADYLGYGRFLFAYKIHDQVVSVMAHNLIEGGGRHATAEVTWSFPITPYIKGYVQGFSGYGQSLIEFDHHTNSFGIGIALNDWI